MLGRFGASIYAFFNTQSQSQISEAVSFSENQEELYWEQVEEDVRQLLEDPTPSLDSFKMLLVRLNRNVHEAKLSLVQYQQFLSLVTSLLMALSDGIREKFFVIFHPFFVNAALLIQLFESFAPNVVASEFRVNVQGAGNQAKPSVIGLNGTTQVAFQSFVSGSGFHGFVRAFNNASNPDIALPEQVFSNGGQTNFVGRRFSENTGLYCGETDTLRNIVCYRVASNGTQIGPQEMALNINGSVIPNGSQASADAVFLPGFNRTVIVYSHAIGNGLATIEAYSFSGDDVSTLNSTNTVISLNDTTAPGIQENPGIVNILGDRHGVAWDYRFINPVQGIPIVSYFRVIDEQGNPLSPPRQVNVPGTQAEQAAIASTNNQAVVIVKTPINLSNNQTNFVLVGRTFDAFGNPVTAPFMISDFDNITRADDTNPKTIGLPDGTYATVFERTSPGENTAIYFARYQADGTPIISNQPISENKGLTYVDPAIAIDENNQIWITYTGVDPNVLESADIYASVVTLAPVIAHNEMNVTDGETITINGTNIAVKSLSAKNGEEISIQIFNLTHGIFLNQKNEPVDIFSQANIDQNALRFSHDGSGIAPNYTLKAVVGAQQVEGVAKINFSLKPPSPTVKVVTKVNWNAVGGGIGGGLFLGLLVGGTFGLYRFQKYRKRIREERLASLIKKNPAAEMLVSAWGLDSEKIFFDPSFPGFSTAAQLLLTELKTTQSVDQTMEHNIEGERLKETVGKLGKDNLTTYTVKDLTTMVLDKKKQIVKTMIGRPDSGIATPDHAAWESQPIYEASGGEMGKREDIEMTQKNSNKDDVNELPVVKIDLDKFFVSPKSGQKKAASLVLSENTDSESSEENGEKKSEQYDRITREGAPEQGALAQQRESTLKLVP